MAAVNLVPGALVGERYRLEFVLGEGGMGTVWAATHTITRRSVAMKFLGASGCERTEFRTRFIREASAASALKHPNVIEILDVFDHEPGKPVLVMERLEGETLAAKLKHEERLALEEGAELLLPVVSAVGNAHALGMVHRDLKPENIYLAQHDGGTRVKVLDFGIAKICVDQLVGEDSGDTLTNTGSMLGTPCYMAPEQATGEGQVDHRADIWSLGVLLYECLSGVRPIEGENLAQVVTRLVSAGIMPLERLAPELPHEVQRLVMRMLSRDLEQRPADLREVASVLQAYTKAEVPSFGPARSATSKRSQPREAPPSEAHEPARVDPVAPTLVSSPPITESLQGVLTQHKEGRQRMSRGWVLAMLVPVLGGGIYYANLTASSATAGRAAPGVEEASADPTGVAHSSEEAHPASAGPSEGEVLHGDREGRDGRAAAMSPPAAPPPSAALAKPKSKRVSGRPPQAKRVTPRPERAVSPPSPKPRPREDELFSGRK